MNQTQEALEAYIELKSIIELRLDRLAASLTDSVSPEEVRWGHVGNLQHIASELQELCRFAGTEAE